MLAKIEGVWKAFLIFVDEHATARNYALLILMLAGVYELSIHLAASKIGPGYELDRFTLFIWQRLGYNAIGITAGFLVHLFEAIFIIFCYSNFRRYKITLAVVSFCVFFPIIQIYGIVNSWIGYLSPNLPYRSLTAIPAVPIYEPILFASFYLLLIGSIHYIRKKGVSPPELHEI